MLINVKVNFCKPAESQSIHYIIKEKRRYIMGFNFKEKFQNLNKKNVIIVASILCAVLAVSIGGFEYYQYKKFQTEKTSKSVVYDMPDLTEQGQPKRPSDYKVGIDYNQAMKGKKPVLALFYADWCGYCVRFMPIFQALSEKYKDDVEFAKVNVEDPNYEKVVKEIGITGFPTVFILDPKYDNKVLISNASLSSVEDVSVELDRFVRIRKLLDKKK